MAISFATLIRAGRVTACHDVSDGGLLVSLAEMALAGGVGFDIAASADVNHVTSLCRRPGTLRCDLQAGRSRSDLGGRQDGHGVEALALGRTEGRRLIVEGLMSISLDDLRQAHEGWFPAFMDARS